MRPVDGVTAAVLTIVELSSALRDYWAGGALTVLL